jgi:hypothetical protein
MTSKTIAAVAASGLIIAGVVAIASTPRDSGPALSNSTTTPTTTTTSTMQRSPGYMGGY